MSEAKGLNYNNKLLVLTQGISRGSAQSAVLDEKTFSDMGLWLVWGCDVATIAPSPRNPNGTLVMAITEQDVQSALKQLVEPGLIER